MQIAAKEREFMKDLAPLLNRSPRLLKCLINIYRLVRARHTHNELIAFLTESEVVSEYQTVLFLLPVDVGLPNIAPGIFDKINETTSGSEDMSYARGQESAGSSAHWKSQRRADVITADHEPPPIKDFGWPD